MQLADKNLFKVHRTDADRFELLKDLGDRYAAMQDHTQARRLYQQACELAPNRHEPYIALGVLEFQADNLLEARKAFAIAAGIEPRCADAYNGLAMVHQQRKDFPAAFDMYLKCLELDADNLIALLGLFQTSCSMGTFAQIIHYLETYLQKHSDDAAVLFCLATLYAREGKLLHARWALRKVLACEPGKPQAVEMLAAVESGLAAELAKESVA